ncbi:MAG: GNAT family N-acetyltransferase [Acidobacteriia bacterium]|nr:GNAT family N-acetyltransferase [Terriglobia bacterium]
MNEKIISTERLDLIAATAELARTEMEDTQEFSRQLGVRVPEDWPPPLNDAQSMNWTLRFLLENPDGVGWATWYFVLRANDPAERTAIGNGGFKGKPTPDGTVEVGYSLMEQFQRRGYATEAVRALLKWALDHPQVNRVIAETYPELLPSIRVMEKNGFIPAGKGSEERVIRFEITRERSGIVT